ncbi:hypothetical protein GUJ93_ZPchr0004g39288 [Zizania palustris]|uniref:Amine oxidase domain-containing protein n=1 Tax=Zizania palustris TaxID=103762 RepID=A0A8J5S1Q0_ZIZPA|nr:hypothetical protein GUJ93_ZPchr0004g39288 [Zizania palustris]
MTTMSGQPPPYPPLPLISSIPPNPNLAQTPIPAPTPTLVLPNPDFPHKRKCIGFRRKVPSRSPAALIVVYPSAHPPPPSSSIDDIIVINRELIVESVTALIADFPLAKETFAPLIPPHYNHLLSAAYSFLVSHSYVNFGVTSAIKEHLPKEPTRHNIVIVIGVGLTGLTTSRKLMAFEWAGWWGGGVSPVDPEIHKKVEGTFNKLLDKSSLLRASMGEVAMNVSLGAALNTLQQTDGGVSTIHRAGDELVQLAHSKSRALAENVPIVYERTVHTVRYGGDEVQVVVNGGQVNEGDMVLCTVPLGVLKNGGIKFVPELPQRKLDGIKRLGSGLLNKSQVDVESSLLMALVAGEAAHNFETTSSTDAIISVLKILRGIFEPQGIEIPDQLQSVCTTRWGTDSFSLGSYSHVAVGASGDDYDILAESVGDGMLIKQGHRHYADKTSTHDAMMDTKYRSNL